MQRIDERSLVEADEARACPAGYAGAQRRDAGPPARRRHHADRPAVRAQHRRDAGVRPGRDRGLDADHRRLRANAARLDDRRAASGSSRPSAETAVIECAGNGRAFFPRAGRHGAVAARRGRLRALDRRAAWRPAAAMRTAAAGGLHRPPQPGRLSRRLGPGDLARPADRQGAGAGNAGGLRAQRRAAARRCTAGRCGWSRRAIPARRSRNG